MLDLQMAGQKSRIMYLELKEGRGIAITPPDAGAGTSVLEI
jgi:hypothetical protein